MDKESARKEIAALVNRFEEQYASYTNANYNETLTRRDFIDPFFEALGWDIANKQDHAEAYREVIHEDKVTVGTATKAPDYAFRLGGGKRLFFVEAKKPSVDVKGAIQPAYQVRRYGWSAKLPISIITDFEEFAVYDCSKKPNPTDKASVARIRYLTFREYLTEFDFLWTTFSKEYVLKGSFDSFVKSTAHKKGTTTVDHEFLQSLDRWRTLLAENVAKLNKELDEDEINYAVQQFIDRIIFLRIAEDRSVEPYGSLQTALHGENYYENLFDLYKSADKKYNSGLFDFKKDQISANLVVDNKTIKTIVNELYYPESPYEFSVLSVEILGNAYEQFLGKQIKIDKNHRAKIEEKPEVRKAGGVYYTPQYIVEYIVANTVGKLVEGKTPETVAALKIVDPACGSGSFLLGAYQYLLDWHKDYYTQNVKKSKKDNPLTPDGTLTTAEKKRILLNNIFGVDIDTNAVEVTKLSLLLKCMEGETQASISHQMALFKERVLPTLDDNIKSGNSLIDLDFYDNQLDFGEEKKIKPFSWQKEFPQIFKQGGFDAVIGNPPYGATFSPVEKEYLRTQFAVSEGNFESFSFFIERAAGISGPKSRLGYIIPDTWFNLKSAYKLRQFVLNNFGIVEIQMLNENVFHGAKVDVCTFIFTKQHSSKPFDVLIYDKDADDKDIAAQRYLVKNSFSQNHLSADPELSFRFNQTTAESDLVNKVRTQPTILSNYCQIGSGCKPYEVGKGTPPQTAEQVNDKIYTSPKKKNKTYRLLLRGADISRYFVADKDDEWLSYGNWLAAPRDSALFEGPRLLFQSIRNPKLKRRLVGTLVDDESVNNNSITNIVLTDHTRDLKLFLGILNSNLMNWYFSVSYNIVNIDPRYLKMVPIPKSTKFDSEIAHQVGQLLISYKEKSLAHLGSKIAQIQSKIDYCENKINQLVYQLYELTPDEIKIVEGHSS